MKIAVGCDHGGYRLKTQLIDYLKKKKTDVIDAGCFCLDSCDYPEYSYRVAKLVSGRKVDRGILICKSGIGSSIVANKLKGVRAALCLNAAMAKSSREHNDANILVLGSIYVNRQMAQRMISLWLKTRHQKGRHARRVRQISRIERLCRNV